MTQKLSNQPFPNDVLEYVMYVKEDLMELYKLSENEAEKCIIKSKFSQVIKKFPEQVLHYETDYWADKIYDEQIKEIVQIM